MAKRINILGKIEYIELIFYAANILHNIYIQYGLRTQATKVDHFFILQNVERFSNIRPPAHL